MKKKIMVDAALASLEQNNSLVTDPEAIFFKLICRRKIQELRKNL